MRTISVIWILVLLTMAGGVAQPEPNDPREWPVLVIWFTSGGMREPAPHGLQLAVWEDGTMLFAPHPTAPSKHMMRGEADPADVKKMLANIKQADLFDPPMRKHGASFPDGDSVTMSLKDGSRYRSRIWDEVLPTGDFNGDADYRDFVSRWRLTRAAVLGVTPNRIERLSELPDGDKSFRGYDVANPKDTYWIRVAFRGGL